MKFSRHKGNMNNMRVIIRRKMGVMNKSLKAPIPQKGPPRLR